MAEVKIIGQEAVEKHGWFIAHRFLILRRISQLSIIGFFLLGPLLGIWLIKGNMASSLLLDTVPLTDPLVALQNLFASQSINSTALTGALIILSIYLIVGGRTYCSWVCPINIVTDIAEWFRRTFNLKGGAHFSKQTRYWFLLAILILSAGTGSLAYELVNPVSMVFRGIVFGMGMGWGILLGIFLLDLFVARSAWCSHLCPVGAFYSLIGKLSIIRISATNRNQCNDCMDCFAVCPEPKVIQPALRGEKTNTSPVILSGQCTNCARCIDVCAEDVFKITHRFNHSTQSNTESNSSILIKNHNSL